MSDDLPAPHLSEYRPASRWGWYLLQIVVTLGIAAWGFEGLGRQGSLGIWLGIGFFAALMVTTGLYWSIRGMKRLLGYPPEGKLIPPRGAFENLNTRGQKQID